MGTITSNDFSTFLLHIIIIIIVIISIVIIFSFGEKEKSGSFLSSMFYVVVGFMEGMVYEKL